MNTLNTFDIFGNEITLEIHSVTGKGKNTLRVDVPCEAMPNGKMSFYCIDMDNVISTFC